MPRPPGFNPAVSHAWTLLAWRGGYSPTVMARHAGISVAHLRRLCVGRWGEPLVTWLQERRLVAAEQLLREGRKVGEIAPLVGYRQATHFSRHFRRSFGVSPKRYQAIFRRRWPTGRQLGEAIFPAIVK